jgi:two-component system cell cycle sensor histidine kinase/response regulator CckA
MTLPSPSPMETPLRILVLEDKASEAEMLIRDVKRAGFNPEWRRVETEADFLMELAKAPDLILSDYSLPHFDGLRAVALVRERGLDTPFILVSGTLGEEAAVEAMKFGVDDYLMKGRTVRLGLAIRRVLEEKRLRGERNRAERQNLIQAQALEAAANAIVITDRQGKILSVNQAFTTLTGYSREEALGQNSSVFRSGTHDASFYRHLWETVLNGKVWQGEITNRRKDGTLCDEEMTITPIRADGVEITHFIAVKQDVTDRKRAEKELRWRTALIEAQFESSIDGILVVDRSGKRILQNRRMGELWKIPQSVAEDEDDSKQVRFVTGLVKNPKQFAEKVADLYAHPDDVGRDEIELLEGTILDRYSAPVRDTHGNLYGRIWVFRDITARRKLEQQFLQSQKMEAIGQLASGVAHDFNNILAVIQMQASLLKCGENLSPEQNELTDDIGEAVQRAAALTRQLLLFSRKEVVREQDLDLNRSIESMMRMLLRTICADIEIQLKLAGRPMLLNADPGMMDQVLLNLAVNARDAMPKGGQLAIETSGAEFDGPAASHSAQIRPGSFVCLSVSDTGCGIPAEVMSKIFEPFFTTKEVGKGTGLGLATVFGIVQQHHGWINVDSEVGQGTTFRIYLPRLAKLSGKTSHDTTVTTLPGGKETLLLVEDEPALCAMVQVSLSRLGYQVLDAANGIEALAVWKEHCDEIQLVLTDMVMPGGMNGIELGAQLLKENPKLKVIYTSGYSAEVAGKDFPLKEGVNFLNKPYQRAKLAQTVRAMLDA